LTQEVKQFLNWHIFFIPLLEEELNLQQERREGTCSTCSFHQGTGPKKPKGVNSIRGNCRAFRANAAIILAKGERRRRDKLARFHPETLRHGFVLRKRSKEHSTALGRRASCERRKIGRRQPPRYAPRNEASQKGQTEKSLREELFSPAVTSPAQD